MAKADKIEYAKRVHMVQGWILQDFLASDIVEKSTDMWQVSERQAMRYLSDAHKAFQGITEKKAERRLNYHLQRRNKLLRDMEEKYRRTPTGLAIQLSILRDIAKLEQLYKIQIEHTGKDGEPLPAPVINILALSDEQH